MKIYAMSPETKKEVRNRIRSVAEGSNYTEVLFGLNTILHLWKQETKDKGEGRINFGKVPYTIKYGSSKVFIADGRIEIKVETDYRTMKEIMQDLIELFKLNDIFRNPNETKKGL